MTQKITLQYHIQFNTKERRTFLKDINIRKELKNIFQNIANEQNVTIETLAVTPDHVHMYISVPEKQNFNLARFMNFIKGKSSYLIKKQFPLLKDIAYKGLWGRSYFARIVDPATAWKVKSYINKHKNDLIK